MAILLFGNIAHCRDLFRFVTNTFAFAYVVVNSEFHQSTGL